MNSNRDSETQSAGARTWDEYQKKRILELHKEFRFAVDCLKAVLRDSSIQWEPKLFPPQTEPLLCSVNIILAMHHLVSIEIVHAIDHIFHSWFDGSKLTFPRFKQLVDMLATNYSDSPVTPRKFLEFCCTVAEISAIMYVGGIKEAPDYGILCIFYCMLCSIGGKQNPEFFQDLDSLALNIIASHAGEKNSDPIRDIEKHRQRILSGFRVTHCI